MVYAGLHLDQAQGLFLQQPLYLLGVLGLAALWREDRRVLLWLVLLYHSILLPNATHPNCVWRILLRRPLPLELFPALDLPYGGFSGVPARARARRFQAGAHHGRAVSGRARLRWIPRPDFLLSTASEKGLARNTLFGGNVPYALPSFYDPQLYASEAVNLLAAAGVLVFALGGGAAAA